MNISGRTSAPDIVTEENEPKNIEQDGTKEKKGICATEALTATLNCNQSKQGDRQIYQ